MKKNKSIFKNKLFVLFTVSTALVLVIASLIKGSIFVGIGAAILYDLIFLGLITGNKKKKKRKPVTKSKSSSKKKETKTIKTKPKKKKVLKIVLIAFFTFFLLVAIVTSAFFYNIVKSAPDFDPDKLYQKEASILYDANGGIIAKLGIEKRENITYEQLPEVLVDAIIATEDSRFFQHNGFDLPRFVKASLGQVTGNSGAGGASTLTMQVVKNHFTSTNDKGFEGIKRKFTDIYMAIFKVEKEYSKQEIIEFYVNSNYLGGGTYGVEQACLTYFGKSAKDINLSEAAIIAGLFQSPGVYDPFINPDMTEKRRATVLYLMERHGYITNEEKEAAASIPVESLLANLEQTGNMYQGFINTVVEEVEELTGNNPYSVPMKIYTTMDPDKQEHLFGILSGDTFEFENEVIEAGVSIIDVETGAIVAVGTGRDADTQRGFNHATMIERQIGSTSKPLFDYGPGIEYNNWSTYHPFTDEEVSYSGTDSPVSNWNGVYTGFTTLRNALIKSINTPALKAFQSISNKNVKEFVTNLGLNPELESGVVHEAHAIGGYNGESPLSMSAAYASFANGGFYTEPYSFTKITYRENGDEFENKKTKERVMKASTAYMVADMLVEAKDYNLGRYSNINGDTFGAKTGTTNFPTAIFDEYDLPRGSVNDFWIVGMNPEYSIALWYGYDKINTEYVNSINKTGERARLFSTIAKGIFNSDKKFTRPSDVVTVAVEYETYPAKLVSEFTPEGMIRSELFKKGTEPTEVSNRYSKLADVTNLVDSAFGSTVALSWDVIETPQAIDLEILTSYFETLYAKETDQQAYLAARVAHNEENIGAIGYNVYRKLNETELELIGFTEENTYDIDSSFESTSSPTYVVKAVYSIFKENESEGTSITVDLSAVPSVSATLNGASNYDLNVGNSYTEPTPPVTIIYSGEDVTSDTTISSVILDKDNNIVTTINTSSKGSYTITYSIKYQGFKKTLVRTINID